MHEANILYLVVSKFCDVDLHPNAVPNDQMGLIFENLIRRFNEPANETAGDHFTPREIAQLFYFDAVKIYEALQGMTAMQPVVVNPAISFSQLARELVQVTSDVERGLVRDQFVAKLQRKKRYLSEVTERDFETCAGTSPEAFIERLYPFLTNEAEPAGLKEQDEDSKTLFGYLQPGSRRRTSCSTS